MSTGLAAMALPSSALSYIARLAPSPANGDIRCAASPITVIRHEPPMIATSSTGIVPPWGEHRLEQVRAVAVEEWLASIKRAKGTKAKIRNSMRFKPYSASFRCANEHSLLDAATGLRVSELLALKWEDVDFENLEIRVTESIWH